MSKNAAMYAEAEPVEAKKGDVLHITSSGLFHEDGKPAVVGCESVIRVQVTAAFSNEHNIQTESGDGDGGFFFAQGRFYPDEGHAVFLTERGIRGGRADHARVMLSSLFAASVSGVLHVLDQVVPEQAAATS